MIKNEILLVLLGITLIACSEVEISTVCSMGKPCDKTMILRA
jgi:hypothetical protein